MTAYRVPVPGSCVWAHVQRGESSPDEPGTVWEYSLWNEGEEVYMISRGTLDFKGLHVTPEQVGRVAFILDVEYGPGPNRVDIVRHPRVWPNYIDNPES